MNEYQAIEFHITYTRWIFVEVVVVNKPQNIIVKIYFLRPYILQILIYQYNLFERFFISYHDLSVVA